MKLNYKRTFFIGLAFLSISAFWQLYDTIIPLILKNNFFIRDSLIGVIMALDNILALFLLPFFGMLSDRTKSPLGKRTPYILIGTLVSVIFMMIIPNAAYNGNFTLFFV
ncbi:MFS transporter, partial [Vibrio parahaemolyticus]|nr:MFS transporter [Vibrio parahaemolyticus]